jgi:hypothetical protein
MRFTKVMCVALVALPLANAARAETYCASHDKLATTLQSKFGEQQLGMGLAGKGALVELYVSKEGTFTLVTTDTSGLSCIVGAGDSWEKYDPKEQLSAL